MSKKNVFVIQSTAFVLSDGIPTVACALAAIRQHLEDMESAGIFIEQLRADDVGNHADMELDCYVPYEFDDHGKPVEDFSDESVTQILNKEAESKRRLRLVDALREVLDANDFVQADVNLICSAVAKTS